MPRWLIIAMLLAGCASSGDRAIEREVDVLIGEPGAAADAAESALVARGADAILFLETGLWRASPHGRKRVIRTLESIGDPEALAIIEIMAARDPDAEVRARAEKARRAMTPTQ